MNDRFKVIAQYSNERIIERVIDFTNYEADKSIFNLDDRMTKIFPNGVNISVGDNIEAFDDLGNRHDDSILYEMGLLELKENEVLDNGEIREKTEVELFRENKDINENREKTIDTSKDGTEYIRQKTMLEKCKDKLITREKYNAWVAEQRQSEYASVTDKMNFRLLFDSGLSETEKIELRKEIEDNKLKIKEKHKKIV